MHRAPPIKPTLDCASHGSGHFCGDDEAHVLDTVAQIALGPLSPALHVFKAVNQLERPMFSDQTWDMPLLISDIVASQAWVMIIAATVTMTHNREKIYLAGRICIHVPRSC